MELSDSDKLWNRAALEGGGTAAREGDQALAALLAVHGMIMNGSVHHALEVLGSAKFAGGVAGFRYFGFDEVAALLDAATVADVGWELFDKRYGACIADDGVLVRAFEKRYAASPNAFAPLQRANA